jgi:hypothetical protein
VEPREIEGHVLMAVLRCLGQAIMEGRSASMLPRVVRELEGFARFHAGPHAPNTLLWRTPVALVDREHLFAANREAHRDLTMIIGKFRALLNSSTPNSVAMDLHQSLFEWLLDQAEREYFLILDGERLAPAAA